LITYRAALRFNYLGGSVGAGSAKQFAIATRGQAASAATAAGEGVSGMVIAPHGHGIYYVDDVANTLRLLR
jgi:hypothetical protein